MKDKTIVVWFSCGAASAVAAKLALDHYGTTNRVLIVNNPVAEEDEDNVRFKHDCEKWLGVPIMEATNDDFPSNSIVEVFDKRKYMSGTKGAPCTALLKKEARYRLEKSMQIDFHVLGFTIDEWERAYNFHKSERANSLFPLIGDLLTKGDCFKVLAQAGIEVPRIYSLGYPNANCIGCVKATSPTYWNLVRDTFPEVFAQRAEQSRRIGCRLVRVKGKRIFLDELKPTDTGAPIKSWECGIWCDAV